MSDQYRGWRLDDDGQRPARAHVLSRGPGPLPRRADCRARRRRSKLDRFQPCLRLRLANVSITLVECDGQTGGWRSRRLHGPTKQASAPNRFDCDSRIKPGRHPRARRVDPLRKRHARRWRGAVLGRLRRCIGDGALGERCESQRAGRCRGRIACPSPPRSSSRQRLSTQRSVPRRLRDGRCGPVNADGTFEMNDLVGTRQLHIGSRLPAGW